MGIINLTEKTFDEEVLNTTGVVLVDFWAPWCGPCRMVGPVLEEIANEKSDVKIAKINVDEEENLALKFNVMSIPTLIVFKDGKSVTRVTGARDKEGILELLNV